MSLGQWLSHLITLTYHVLLPTQEGGGGGEGKDVLCQSWRGYKWEIVCQGLEDCKWYFSYREEEEEGVTDRCESMLGCHLYRKQEGDIFHSDCHVKYLTSRHAMHAYMHASLSLSSHSTNIKLWAILKIWHFQEERVWGRGEGTIFDHFITELCEWNVSSTIVKLLYHNDR